MGEMVRLTVDCDAVEIVICPCSLVAAPRESVAVTQKNLVTTALDMPVTAPVDEFRTKPAGSAPSVTANL